MESTNEYIETDLGNVSLNPRGEYNDTANYEYLDLVNYQGGSYVCTAPLRTTIARIAPIAGKDTENWQLLTLPGSLTAEYLAAHDAVIEKARQVEVSRAAVELSQTEIEAAEADVRQMRKDTQTAAQEAQENKESASGHAQSAEASRLAAETAEQNATAQVQGFDLHVTEKKTEAEQSIIQKRQEAVNVVQAQEETSQKVLKKIADDVAGSTEKAETAATTATSAATRAETAATTATSAAKTATTSESSIKEQVTAANNVKTQFDQNSTKALSDLEEKRKQALADVESAETEVRKEIEDARTDRKGKIYDTLGDAIRGQFAEIGLYINEDGDLCQKEE